MTKLLTDSDIAYMLGLSRSWVRKERFNRRRGNPHTFNLEPVLIGSMPRYLEEEVMGWIEVMKIARGGV